MELSHKTDTSALNTQFTHFMFWDCLILKIKYQQLKEFRVENNHPTHGIL